MKTNKQTLDLIRCFDEAGQPLLKIMLSPWGNVSSTNGDFVVDEEGCALCVADFQERKLPLPIDYEHTTEGGKFSTPSGAAPAAGWIEALVPEPGSGLFAMVKWNEPARSMILNDEYRYLSPVILVEKESRRCVAVRSAALTNTPAIRDMARVAAKETEDMDLKQLESEVKAATDALRKSLTDAGVTLAENLGWTDILKAAQAFAASVVTAKAEAEKAPPPTATIAAKMGLDAAATVEVICAKVGELVTGRVPADDLAKAVARIEELELLERTRGVDRLVAKAIEDGLVNPNDAPRLAAVKELAQNPTTFALWEKLAPKVVPTGRVVVASEKLDGKKTDREAVILKAREEYKDPKNAWVKKNGAEPFYVDAALKMEGLDPLSETEVKAL